MNKVILLVRRTESYYFTRIPDNEPSAVLDKNAVKDVHWRTHYWEKLVGKSYSQIRNEIEALAYDHNIKQKPDIVYNYHVRSIPNDDNIWILPIDEDDLADRDGIDYIRNFEGSENIIIWNTLFSEVDKKVIRVGGQKSVQSNAYAIRSSYAHKFPRLILKHMGVKKNHEHLAHRTDSIFGFKIENPASIGRLWSAPSAEQILDKITKFRAIDSSVLSPEMKELFTKIQDVFTLV